ncbi:HAD-IA family hydrolase [Carboxylicivirga mesophila]|uniref:HAD-IA family hydrolase n=1 Tax=Carboxylicivirga mesophila TaxID=1166478 RepID=A0ABS5KCV8_9BACT|nr:HAD-IA family hydrolase [Carboxylicivirga mesophila]MBS2212333.1 HAD-IA family hydrolase [Carboxylicivirga mesophila]
MSDNKALNQIVIPQHIKGLIFDMDGTLLNSTPIHYKAWLAACQPFGVDFEYEYFIGLTGRPVVELGKDLIDTFGMDIAPEELVQNKENLVEQNLHNVEIVEAVYDVVKRYEGLLPMAVGTGASRERAMRLLSNSGIINHFEAVITSDDVDNYKPHPDTFLKAAEAIKVNPAECMVFEDGHLGMDAAVAAGMHVIDVKPYYR